ncbi:MAG: hypothetical protein PHP86_01230 [Nevskiales bacterium]|nr:hypothetical protein [Nevskiales bacterium]
MRNPIHRSTGAGAVRAATRGLAGLCLLATLAACQYLPFRQEPEMTPTPGYVTDLNRFEAFIARHPTPEAFRTAYPDVLLVLPGDIATKELRFNNSRYFADMDEKERHIVGGRFR